jgi:NAD+ diphosphatase
LTFALQAATLYGMLDTFRASVIPPESASHPAWWFIFTGYRLMVRQSGDNLTIPQADSSEDLGIAISPPLHLGTLGGHPCFAAAAEEGSKIPVGAAFEDLRSLFSRIDDTVYEAALTAIHLLEWHRNSQFCGKCRGALKPLIDMRAKECELCRRLEFPRLSPAIIVLVEKEGALLLARSARFTAEFFSVLAGFVEPGESLEAAVHREVKEETGITVKNIRYFGSQPWPFPDSLMIGFTAQYESGEIKIDGEEIVEAGWYRAGNLPPIPGKLSIARQLIDWFVAKQDAGSGAQDVP